MESNKLKSPAVLLLLLAGYAGAGQKYACGKSTKVNRPYGQVEQRVRCEDKADNSITVLEYQGDVQHGLQMGFDTLWRKRDSVFYVNGKENGVSLFWDTAGNVIGRENYRDGRLFGKREFYFAPGKPSLIKSHNAEGKPDGPWSEWWSNGNKKAEYEARNGEIVSAVEYYENGKTRVRYRSKYEPENPSALHIKRIEGEAWAPNGKSTGKIVKGNGGWIVFPDGSKPNAKAFRLEYKDSLLVKTEKLDSAEMAKWTR